MGLGWTISDATLLLQLQAYLDSLGDADYWYLDLFVNDYTPGAGDTYADYNLPTWAGYGGQTISLPDWGTVSVSDHVASSSYPTTFKFSVPVPADDATVYGYLVSDRYRNFVYSEGWLNPIPVSAGSVLLIQPVLRLGVYPPPDMFLRRARTAKRMGVEVPADASEGE